MLTKIPIIHPSPAISADPTAQLEAALTVEKAKGYTKEYYRLKTELEQAAGRKANEEGRRNTKVLNGKEELQRRFGTHAVLTASWEARRNDVGLDELWVDVLIQPADGSEPMCFTEHFEMFPSEECIANIALVV